MTTPTNQNSSPPTTEANTLRFTAADVVKFGGMLLVAGSVVMTLKQGLNDIKTEMVGMRGQMAAQDQQIAELKARVQHQEQRLNTEVPAAINSSLGELKQDIRWIIQRLSESEDR